MSRVLYICLGVLLVTSSGNAATAVHLESGQEQTLTIPDLTAAYATRPDVVDVSAEGGTLRFTARQAGSTNVVVVTLRAVELIEVSVAAAKLAAIQPAVPVEREGMHLFRYSSHSSPFQDVLDWRERQGDRLVQIHIGTNYQSGGSRSYTIPSVFYRVQTGRRQLTLLDETITASALTVDNASVRGIHLRQGPWEFHAGYSSFAALSDLILPIDPQRMLSGSYRHPLTGGWSLTPSFFICRDRTGSNGSGTVLSLLTEYDRSSHTYASGEVAVSRSGEQISYGVAGELRHQSERSRAHATLRYRPANFASLRVTNSPGLFANAEWQYRFDSRLSMDLWSTIARTEWRNLAQTSISGAATVHRKLTPSFTMASGAHYSLFESERAEAVPIRMLSLPIDLSFDRPRYGFSGSYRYNYDSVSRENGQGLRLEARVGSERLRLTAYADHEQRVPTLDWIFSDLPEVRRVLQQIGVSVAAPSELARILREHPELVGLGLIDRVDVSLAAARLQTGASLRWSGRTRRSPTVSLDVSRTRDRSGAGRSYSDSYSLSYTREIAAGVEWELGYSLLESRRGNALARKDALWHLSFRHRFERLPFSELPGTISGVVFHDALETGKKRDADAGLRGVEVMLDSKTRTETDAQGRFEFRRVPRGTHQIEVTMRSERPFRFTTPSQIDAQTGQSVAVGVAFLASQLMVDVRNHSGKALANVVVAIEAAGEKRTAVTNSSGRVAVPILEEGLHRVSLVPETLPVGYDLQELREQELRLDPKQPYVTAFTLDEIRTVGGKLRITDGTAQKRAAVGGVTVQLEPLGRQSTTDANGNFVFRSLPAGSYELKARIDNATAVRRIEVPDRPVTMRVDLDVRTTGGLP